MRTAVLFASPRANGVTAALTRTFLCDAPGRIDRIDVCALHVHPCDGCGGCGDGVCRYDDLQPVFQLLLAADRIVLASPVYFYSFPSQMKTLVDRLQPFFCCPPVRRTPAKGVLLTAAGSKGVFAFDLMRRQAKRVFECLGADLEGSFCKGETDLFPALTAEESSSLRALALSFFSV